MSREVVISLKNVSKSFKLRQGRPETIRDFLLRSFTSKQKAKELRALNRINVDIYKGETFGIVGRNGSGKSTLIHIIMGSMKANPNGKVETRGKLMRLALGMGMDPKLTARDNIYVNGSILGLSFKKIGEAFNDIISYADLEDFIDTPVKKYSKGMMARLKFSIAMHADADVFLLDEFFGGVGDQDFKEKSNAAFQQRFVEGKTNVLVSHSMKTIGRYCDRVMWIDRGEQKMIGTPKEVVKHYQASFKNQAVSN